jgi:SulP family sulfate permease
LSASKGRRFVALADIPAGIAVAFVLIPQCLAYAELAGMPAHRGLLAAGLPLIVAALFASSPYLQTGPTALTSLFVLAALSGCAVTGSAEYVLLGVLLAGIVGLVRVGISLLRGGRMAYVIAQPVLRGFVLGAAVLIFGSQLPAALGTQLADRGLIGEARWALSHPAAWETEATLLASVAVATILGARLLHRRIPGVLLAMVGGLIYSALTDYSGATVGALAQGQWGLSGPLPWGEVLGLIVPGVIIAVVAYSEALSISQIFAEADGESWDANREFLSQGAANLAAAGLGAFPVGASFSRSSLNRIAGAHSRWSGAVTGLTVLLFVPFFGVLEGLPKALLGAVVIAAIIPMLDPRPLASLFARDKVRGAVALCTLLLTVVLAPRIEFAILVGVLLSLTVDLRRAGEIVVERQSGGTLAARGYLCFLTAGKLERRLREAASSTASGAALDVSRLDGLDVTGRALLDDMLWRMARQGVVLAQPETT